MAKSQVQRQAKYEQGLKDEGRIVLKVTLSGDASFKLASLEDLMFGDKDRREIIEQAIEELYERHLQAFL